MGECYSSVMDFLYRVSMWIAGVALLVMVAIIPIGIFARYVLNNALSWPEPVAILCMVTFTFIGAAVSYRAGSHIAVSMVIDRLGSPPVVTARLSPISCWWRSACLFSGMEPICVLSCGTSP